MGCNCGKKKVKMDSQNMDLVKKSKGFGSKIKKIWKESDNTKVVVKKVDNK